MTKQQVLLLDLLQSHDKAWLPEVVVSIKRCQWIAGLRYPTNYKVDIGHKQLRIAIEVDGKNHNSRKTKERDRKKLNMLSHLGWKVLRFTNQEIEDRSTDVVKMILSSIA